MKKQFWRWLILPIAVCLLPFGTMAAQAEDLPQQECMTITGLPFDDAADLAAEAEIDRLEDVAELSAEELRDITLLPGGMPFGVRFLTEGVTVVGFCDFEQNGKKLNPALSSGMKAGDVILQVNDLPLESAEDLTGRIESGKGAEMTLLCRRGKKEVEIHLTPVWSDAESRYKTGMWVRDNGAGIGTVTFLLPETGAFAGLGHGICDADSGQPVPIRRGSVSDVTISAVVKGTPGNPGELKGYFNAGKVGTLLGNSVCGVWGVYSEPPAASCSAMHIAAKEEVQEGDATILCTLADNVTREYHVRLSSVNREADGPKCFTVTVTDPRLLEQTGGIVQGMSGSPILQNGKLVGAVTHVLVNDPTTGYGIFLENMLSRMPIVKERE